ncbi:hypothetical protein VPH35_076003 [Triticum aestivum]|uniref:Uncharacterized protein n=1 Tax=Aegilops tauschii TaxID=37682 RepID=M8C8B0_AEGTA
MRLASFSPTTFSHGTKTYPSAPLLHVINLPVLLETRTHPLPRRDRVGDPTKGNDLLKSCSSSFRITKLFIRHVKGRWKEHILDAASYTRFNDHTGRNQDQEWGLGRPFDESVIIWHITTDLCFYQKFDAAASDENAKGCMEISNYRLYLLFINPEMLLPGTNRNLFKTANTELEEILKDDKPFLELLKRKGPSPEEMEKGLMDRIIAKLQPPECKEEDPGNKSRTGCKGFIYKLLDRYAELAALVQFDAWQSVCVRLSDYNVYGMP